MYGRKFSEDTRKKQSKAQSGILSPNYGKFGKNNKNYGKGKLHNIITPNGDIIFKITMRLFCDMFNFDYDSCSCNIKSKYGYKKYKILKE